MNVEPVSVCPRCGAEHEPLIVKSIDQPIVEVDGTVWDSWALCPVSQDPILFRRALDSKDLDKVTIIDMRQAWLYARYEPLEQLILKATDLTNPSAHEDLKYLLEVVRKLLARTAVR